MEPAARQGRSSARWRLWGAPVALFGVLFLIYSLTAQTSTKVSVDVYSSSLAAWRIAHTGDPWLDGFDTTRIDGYGSLPDQIVFIAEAANGHRVPHRLPGVVAATVPAYWIAGGGSEAQDFSMAPQAFTAALLTSGSVVLFFIAVRRRVGDAQAVAGALVLAVGTPLWSVAANAMWTHTVTVFGIAGMAWAASRDRWWLVGVFGGIAISGRLHVALIVAILGTGVALARRSPGVLTKVALPSSALLGLTALWTYWAYGTWLPGVGYNMSPSGLISGERYPESASTVLNQLGLWVSPDKGILIWTPLLVLMLPAVIRSWQDLPDWSRWLALGALPYMALQAQLNPYTGGGAHYAYRLSLELLAAVAPAYIISAPRMKTFARVAIVPVVAIQVATIGVGAVLDAPTPEVSYGWTDNAFLVAMRLAPGLGVLVVLVVALVIVVELAWRDIVLRPAAAADKLAKR